MLTGEVSAGAVWCKSWHCEFCAPIRQKQLMAQAANGHPNKFITLTSRNRSETMTPSDAARELVHAWRMVIQRGKREKIFNEIQYVAVFELTEKGWPHLHILARTTFLPKAWLSARMADYADSPIVDVRKVKSKERAAWYVAKYTAKAPEKFEGCKRYWRTLRYDLSGICRRKNRSPHIKGYLNEVHVSTVAGFYEKQGYRVAWDSDHSFIAIPGSLDVHLGMRMNYRKKWVKQHKEPPS